MRGLSVLMMMLLPLGAMAQDGPVKLYAPDALTETGLLRHILPRFSLKTQVRVAVVDRPEGADLTLSDAGAPLFQGGGTVWHLGVATDHRGAEKLAKWLRSDVGLRTITGFAPEGTPLFGPRPEGDVQVVVAAPVGNIALGLKVAQRDCTRCHAVEKMASMGGIGSTPSFPVLRTLEDWQGRFEAFYVLAPHPAFTQIDAVTPPFPEDRPPPIVPIRLTLEEVEAVAAYVASLPAADLGAPLQHQ